MDSNEESFIGPAAVTLSIVATPMTIVAMIIIEGLNRAKKPSRIFTTPLR
jgi:hypothetical protein